MTPQELTDYLFLQKLATFPLSIDWKALSSNPCLTWSVLKRHLDKPWYWFAVTLNNNFSLDRHIFAENAEWDPSGVSSHREITMDCILNKPDFPWDWNRLSQNPGIRLSDIQTHWNTLPWCLDGLSRHAEINWQFLMEHLTPENSEKWSWKDLSSAAGISIENILSRQDFNWDWSAVSRRQDVTWAIVASQVEASWDWSELSHHPNIPWEAVQMYPGLPWDWFWVSIKPVVTWETVRKNISLPWNLAGLSLNQNVTMDIIKEHSGVNWDWGCLSRNWGITWGDIQSNPDLPWHWALLRFTNMLPNAVDCVAQFPTKPWNFTEISRNPFVSWESICEHPEWNWDYGALSQNPCLSWNAVVSKPEKPWDLHHVCRNTAVFCITPQDYQHGVKQHIAARRIQCAWAKRYKK